MSSTRGALTSRAEPRDRIRYALMRGGEPRLPHRFSSADAARRFCQACNVIVTTPPALLPPRTPEISNAVLNSCSHLFVDEAHHVEARSWRQIRDGFDGKLVLQFTATPFREDGIPLAGRQVYRYLLSVAQAHGLCRAMLLMALADPA